MSNFTTVITICDRPHIGGGASKIAIETAATLARIGVNSYFFSALGDPDPSLIESGVVCVNCGQNDVLNGGVSCAVQGIWNRRSEKALDDLLKQLDPKTTVVHVHSWTHSLSPSIFRAIGRRGFKCLITAHEYFLVCSNGGLYDYVNHCNCGIAPGSPKCLLHNCDKRSYAQKLYRSVRFSVQNHVLGSLRPAVAFVSDSSRRLIEPHLAWNSERYDCLNYVDAAKSQDDSEGDSSAYLFVGRLSPEKGCDLFCEAVCRAGVNAIVIGDGTELKRLSDSYPDIRFMGSLPHDEVLSVMRQSRAIVMPSVCRETFGLVAYEAMIAAGLPCIVSDVGDAASFVMSKGLGEIFSAGSVESLSDAMVNMLDSDVYSRYREAVEKADFSCLEKTAYVERLIGIYDQLMVEL